MKVSRPAGWHRVQPQTISAAVVVSHFSSLVFDRRFVHSNRFGAALEASAVGYLPAVYTSIAVLCRISALPYLGAWW